MLDKAERAELTDLPQSWSIQLRILFQSQRFLKWDQCTFHDTIWQNFRHGSCTFFLFLLSTKMIRFKSISWQWFPFCKEPDKWTTCMFIFFYIGCTRLGVYGNTSSHFLELSKIGVDTNILSMNGYQTWVVQNGTTIIPSPLSCFTFERTPGMTENRGNA